MADSRIEKWKRWADDHIKLEVYEAYLNRPSETVVAESARALAAKLDQVRDSDTAAAAAAAPGIARQLVDTIAHLSGAVEAPDRLDELRRRREARRLALYRKA